MAKIHCFTFAPFASRRAQAVIGMRIVANRHPRKRLSKAIRAYLAEQSDPARGIVDADKNILVAGDWLSHSRCFFVEKGCWPGIAHSLLKMDRSIEFVKVERPKNVVHYSRDGTKDQAKGSWSWPPTKREKKAEQRVEVPV